MLTIYKPIGQTCMELLSKIKEENNFSKIAFCGRLDPMAHGSLPYVVDEETINSNKYISHNKTYQFRFVIGLSTDTTDVMGIFNNHDYANTIYNLHEFIDYINNIETNTQLDQKYHKFSSFVPKEYYENTKRQPLWYWSTNNRETKDYSKKITIFNSNIISINNVNKNNVIANCVSNIKMVTDQSTFRIPEILQQYEQVQKENVILTEIKMELTVSTGFYIRQYVQDLADKFKVKMMVTEIYRTNIIVQ